MNSNYEKYRHYSSARTSCVACSRQLPQNNIVWSSDSFFNAIECPFCGMIQVEPCLSDEGLTSFYQGYYRTRRRNVSLTQQRAIQYSLDSQHISRFISTGLVLDVGCSDGSFLKALPNSFSKYGIDIEVDPVSSNDDSNLTLSSGFFPESKSFSSLQFDLITFRGVIEHLRNPSSFISKAVSLLRPNGFLYFCATPNVDSPAAHLFRNRWNQWHPIEHPNLFNVNTLHTLLDPSRFDLIDVIYPYLQTPYASSTNDLEAFLSESITPSTKTSPPFWGSMLSAVFQLK